MTNEPREREEFALTDEDITTSGGEALGDLVQEGDADGKDGDSTDGRDGDSSDGVDGDSTDGVDGDSSDGADADGTDA